MKPPTTITAVGYGAQEDIKEDQEETTTTAPLLRQVTGDG